MKRFLILMALAASLLLSGCARGEITVELSGGPYGQACHAPHPAANGRDF